MTNVQRGEDGFPLIISYAIPNNTCMWYVVYKVQNACSSLFTRLDEQGIEYHVPMHYTEKLNHDGTMMEQKKVASINNLIFINTSMNILQLVQQTNGLLAPMKDTMTDMPAVVRDDEMKRFIKIQELKPADVTLLKDPYSKFMDKGKVRVKAGIFEGIEGRIVRIRRNKKLVISLGNMAVAISGIHYSLLEPITD